MIAEVVLSSWFVALPVIAGDWHARLSPTPEGTRLLASMDLHLTVAFLGDVGVSRAREAFRALAPAAIRRFEIVLGPVVAMGNRRRPSALSAMARFSNTSDQSIADLLASPRDRILEAAGLPPETRPMKPHITLARLRTRAGAEARMRALAWAAEQDLSSIRVELDRIALYTGSENRSMSAYRILESRALGAPSAGVQSSERLDEEPGVEDRRD